MNTAFRDSTSWDSAGSSSSSPSSYLEEMLEENPFLGALPAPHIPSSSSGTSLSSFTSPHDPQDIAFYPDADSFGDSQPLYPSCTGPPSSSAPAAFLPSSAHPTRPQGPHPAKHRSPSLDPQSAAEKKMGRQQAHSLSEKKRQQSINTYIEELRGLIPTCNEAKITKVIVLQRCVSFVQRMLQHINALKEENMSLKASLHRLSGNDGAVPRTLLVHFEDQPHITPRRLELDSLSMDHLVRILQAHVGYDPARMEILYADPDFDNEHVFLNDISHLPSKAKIYLRTLSNLVQVPVDTSQPPHHQPQQPLFASHHHAQPASHGSLSPSFPASTSIPPHQANFAHRLLSSQALSSDVVRFFAIGLVYFAFFSIPLEDIGTGNSPTSRTLNRLFPAVSQFFMYHHVAALFWVLSFITKFFFSFGFARYVLITRELSQDAQSCPPEAVLKASELRRKAEAAQQAGQVQQGEDLYLEALSTMGRSPDMYHSALWMTAHLTYHALIQHTHRFIYGRKVEALLTKNFGRTEGIEELARIYFGLFQLQCYSKRHRLRSVTSLLSALNYAEISCEGTDNVFLSEVYTNMASILMAFFPWGSTVILGAPGGYYKTRASECIRHLDPLQSRKMRQALIQQARRKIPFRGLWEVFLVMLGFATYEYSTGHEIISILLISHVLFELILAFFQ